MTKKSPIKKKKSKGVVQSNKTKGAIRKLAKSMAEADADMSRKDLVWLLTDIYIKGCKPLTKTDIEQEVQNGVIWFIPSLGGI